VDAAAHGATILTRTELIDARREQGMWTAKLGGAGGQWIVRARALVNAAGPWASEILDRLGGVQKRRSVRLVKGSHIVLPRLYARSHAYLLQNPDRRIVFAIPFEGRFTLVGTTEVSWAEPSETPAISDDEVAYLLRTVARNFVADVSSNDIVWSYSGVRALPDDGSANPSRVTRDYVLDLDAAGGEPPLLSVFGGKLTTYRRLAERALEKLAPRLGFCDVPWTDGAILPGGDLPELDLDAYSGELIRRHPGFPDALVARLAGTYGTLAEALLDGDLGEDLGGGLHTREVDYLVSNEWARTAEDILFRRTKLGLHVPPGTADRLTAYLGR
jgi:glycerol-3-phosphate dehydrogenase